MPDSRTPRPARPKPPRRPQGAGAAAHLGGGPGPQRRGPATGRTPASGGGTDPARASGPVRGTARTEDASGDQPTRDAASRPDAERSGTAPRPDAREATPTTQRRRPRQPGAVGAGAGAGAARASSTRRSSAARRGRSARSGEARKERDPRTTLSFGGLTISIRLLGIGVVAAVLAGMLVPSLFQWWRQEQDLRDITARVAAAEEQNADMQHQLDLWKDPDYIASQARSRLGYVRPGETQYAVVDPGEGHSDTSQVAPAQPQGPARPWVQVLALSLTEADAPRK